MSLTLRQLQKMFSAAERGIAYDPPTDHESYLGRLGAFVTGGKRWRRANATRDGGLLNACKCAECRQAGTVAHDVRRLVDRWTREHGPNADLLDVIEKEAKKAGGQPEPSTSQPLPPMPPPPMPQGQKGEGGGGNSQAQPTGPAPDSTEASEPEQEQPLQPLPATTQVPPPPQPSPQQKALEAAKKALQDVLATPSKNKLATSFRVADAKRALKRARRGASHNVAAEASGVSLAARKQVSSGLGRLRNVPQRLRNQMAELINRLVEQGGTAGENFGPVPVLSAAKLVKRMVVRRPLPNALKEDTISGRPVVLFLPDISPSCAAQAQPACDLANAAGYAGVRGSDVLVLPHFNGDIEADEEFVPWFNGRPATTNVLEARQLFKEICSGQGSYRVRVAVFIGDHDAVERYGAIAQLRSVTRVLWLHNFARGGSKEARPEPIERRLLPDWRPEAMAKLSMVGGCVDQPRMLKGFDMALKMN